MRGILLVARRDFLAYINSWWGWAILAMALLINGLLFNFRAMGTAPRYSAEVLSDFFQNTGGIALFASAVITMRLFAEERQTGTMVLLESSPLSELQVVLGKYLSGVAVLAMYLVLSLYMPAMIFVNGKVSYAEIAVGYLGVLTMGSAAIAIGTWASSVSRNQIIAVVITAVVLTMFVACWMLSRVLDPPFKAIFAYLAFFDKHMQAFQEGRINTESLVYFGSVTFAFLLLSTRALVARRWE